MAGCYGTMGLGSVPLVNRSSPRAPIGLGPKANRPRTMNRPRNTRATLRPGARKPHILDVSFPDAFWCPNTSSPECFLPRSTTLPNETVNRLSII